MIHGIRNGLGILGRLHLLTDWTAGCIAVTNDEIEEIWRVVPVTTHVHDEDCKIMSKHMEFEAVQIVSIHGCTNSECAPCWLLPVQQQQPVQLYRAALLLWEMWCVGLKNRAAANGLTKQMP